VDFFSKIDEPRIPSRNKYSALQAKRVKSN